jgi:hypothetical protein
MTALKAVREMLLGVVEGVKGVASAALPKTAPKMAGGPIKGPKARSPQPSEKTPDGRFKTDEEYRHEAPEPPSEKTPDGRFKTDEEYRHEATSPQPSEKTHDEPNAKPRKRRGE